MMLSGDCPSSTAPRQSADDQAGSRADKSYRQVTEEVREFLDGPTAVQAMGETAEEICDCARRLYQIDPMLAIKIAANKQGLAAVKVLAPEGVRMNATLIFNPTQGRCRPEKHHPSGYDAWIGML